MTIRHWRKFLYLTVLLIFIAPPCLGKGAGPLEQLKSKFDQMADIMNSPAGKNEKEKQVKKIAGEIIDYKEVAIRALSRHKKKFTPAQLRELADLFARLIKNIYFTKMYDHWTSDVKIKYLEQKISVSKKSGNKYARVKTKIQRARRDVVVEYRLIIKSGSKDGLWKIYDISIEGVSIVKNYRSQFNSILIKKGSGPSELIKAIKKLVKKQ